MSSKDNKVGLYLTVAFHLLLLIILLSSRINYYIQEDKSFMLDFSREEYMEEIARMEAMKQNISREIDELLAGAAGSEVSVRNVIVDASARRGEALRDDRHSNPSEVYDEARRLQESLDAARREVESSAGVDEAVNLTNETEATPVPTESYKGPSVLSYSLDDRKAMDMPIPVYKCIGGGIVSVNIVVNRSGVVLSAAVKSDVSSTDKCLHEYAVEAAKMSRFTASSTAPERQTGEIVYRFIAQ